MHHTVNRPKDVECGEKKPCEERKAGTALRRIELKNLRHERDRRDDTDTIHHIIKKSFPRVPRRKWLKTFSATRARTHMMETEHAIIYTMEGLTNYEKVERPWGNFERFTLNEPTTVKILTLNADASLSLQVHEHRDEFGRVIRGSGIVRVGEKETTVREGDTFFIPRNTEHRVSASSEGLAYLEIAFGEFDESDEKRLEDQYGRA